MPPELGSIEPGRVLHTSEVATIERFAGEEVAIMGAGQSALELAALLLEHGARPTLIVRGPTVAWNPVWVDEARSLPMRMRAPATPLGNGLKLSACWNLMPVIRLLPSDTRAQIVRKILPPAGAGWLRDRVEPAIPVHLGTRVVRVSDEGGRLRLTLRTGADEKEAVVDRLIAGTGYRVAIDRLEFLASELRADIDDVNGAPRLSAHFESRSVPGLYFVGLAAAQTFGPAMRFVCGTAFAGRVVGRHLCSSQRLGRRTRQPAGVAS
jgi:thioredoxin reductase